MQVTDAMVEAGCIGMYGKNWNGPPDRQPGEAMKNVWRKYARDCLTAALAEMWQDIGTAPKDGSPILIAGGTYYNSMSLFNEDYPFEGRTIAKWDDYHRQWRGENSGGHDEYFWHKPTHFMPLPPPPMGRG